MDSPCFQRAVQPSPWAAARGDDEKAAFMPNEAATTAKTPKARTRRKARLHLFPVLALFRPVIAASQATPTDAGKRPFPVFLPCLTGKSPAPGCVRCPVFLLLFTGIYRQTGVKPFRCDPKQGSACTDPRWRPLRKGRNRGTRYSRSSRNGSAS